MTHLSIHAPSLAGAGLIVSYFGCRAVPRVSARLANMELSPTDRQVMKQFSSPRAALALFTRACTRGTRGAVVDYASLARPWGSRAEVVALPTRSSHDPTVPLVPLLTSALPVVRVPRAPI